jgi:nucleoside-diphosphate-sugar epimerase
MRIFVTGATGVIGSRAIPMLVDAGHTVTAAGRSANSLRRLEGPAVSTVVLDLFDVDAVRRAVAGHDAVVNLATHVPTSTFRQFLRSSWREMDRIRTQGSSILVDAAKEAGVTRFIQESFAPIYQDCGSQWIHETVPREPVRYNRSVLDAETSVQRFAEGGGAGVALRFAFFYGPHDAFTSEVITYVRRGWLPVPGQPDAFFPLVHHASAAAAVVAALDAPSGAYNVVDNEPLTRRQLGDTLAARLGTRPPRLPPTWMTPIMGGLGKMLARSLRISNEKLRSSTAWSPLYPTTAAGWMSVVDEMGKAR